MNIKEVFHILETEKFNTYFNNTSLYNKVMLIRLKKCFSEYFFIPEDEFYKTTSNSLFFIQLITSKKILDIEEVKMDIYNKIPDLTLSIKYLEPPEVIKEIKDNMHKDIKLLKNKIYLPNDVSNVLNISKTVITNNKFLNQTAIKYKGCVFWIGDIIIKNLNKISQKSIQCLSVNKDIIPLKELSKLLYSNNSNVLIFRIKNKNKVFGVDLSYTLEEKDKSLKAYFIKNSDFKKILDNKKYYIKIDILRKETKTLFNYEKASIINYHDFIFNKQTCINSDYIKKETVSNIIEIINLYKNDYLGYIDKLYNFINNDKNKFFEIGSIKKLIPSLNSMPVASFNKKLSGLYKVEIIEDKISKENTLKILDYLKSKYKKIKTTRRNKWLK